MNALGPVNTNPAQGEENEGAEEHVKLVVAGEDATKAFQAAKEPLNLVASAVKPAVVAPGFSAQGMGRNHRTEAEEAG